MGTLEELTSDLLMDRLRKLRVHRLNGRPSRHKPLALLWGISRIAGGKPPISAVSAPPPRPRRAVEPAGPVPQSPCPVRCLRDIRRRRRHGSHHRGRTGGGRAPAAHRPSAQRSASPLPPRVVRPGRLTLRDGLHSPRS
ncbi:restriction endonuclease [Streptomyces clavuligerus]|uniref:Restriction endonuclease n=1 Tax=Streptomyces clavuligerus TaxID=1901 RepID=E2Q297_STRCL|nr:restriction endonuclease [Streptomyces clavuligerus]